MNKALGSVNQFIPREGVTQRALNFGMTPWRQLTYSLGQG